MLSSFLFFFNDTATTEIYTLSLHDALPISDERLDAGDGAGGEVDLGLVLEQEAAAFDRIPKSGQQLEAAEVVGVAVDRKSTRLNSSHANISYAVFCLKKKKITPVILTSLNS